MIGIVRALRNRSGMPVVISFTTETDRHTAELAKPCAKRSKKTDLQRLHVHTGLLHDHFARIRRTFADAIAKNWQAVGETAAWPFAPKSSMRSPRQKLR